MKHILPKLMGAWIGCVGSLVVCFVAFALFINPKIERLKASFGPSYYASPVVNQNGGMKHKAGQQFMDTLLHTPNPTLKSQFPEPSDVVGLVSITLTQPENPKSKVMRLKGYNLSSVNYYWGPVLDTGLDPSTYLYRARIRKQTSPQKWPYTLSIVLGQGESAETFGVSTSDRNGHFSASSFANEWFVYGNTNHFQSAVQTNVPDEKTWLWLGIVPSDELRNGLQWIEVTPNPITQYARYQDSPNDLTATVVGFLPKNKGLQNGKCILYYRNGKRKEIALSDPTSGLKLTWKTGMTR